MDRGSWHCIGDRDQDIPMKKKCKKAKWLSDEALQIAEKRREAKGKREKERYTDLNAEFQRTERRDKKAFLSDQWKEIEVGKKYKLWVTRWIKPEVLKKQTNKIWGSKVKNGAYV